MLNAHRPGECSRDRAVRVRRQFARLAWGLIALISPHAAAQQYPQRPIRFVAPYPPGGSADLLARTLAQNLTLQLGQAVVTDNRPGAGGNVGADIVAKARPDGYTILLAPVSPMAINVALYGSKMPFNPERDFAPIALVAKVPLVIAVPLVVPARTLQDFIALARSRPGRMKYGSGGTGSSNHLVGALLMSAAQLDMVHVPYRGGAPGMIALLGGEIDMMVGQIPSTRPLHMAGKIRAIAVSGAKRSSGLPDVPTIIESGLADFEVTAWHSVVAPAGTPRLVIDRLNAEIARATTTPEVRQRLVDEGAEIAHSTPEELARFIKLEIPKWARAVKESGATLD